MFGAYSGLCAGNTGPRQTCFSRSVQASDFLLCAWVLRSAFCSGDSEELRVWGWELWGPWKADTGHRLPLDIAVKARESSEMLRILWVIGYEPQFRNKDCVFRWPFSLLTVDPDQAQQTWSRGMLTASKQPKIEEWPEGSKWLHSLGLHFSSIYLLSWTNDLLPQIAYLMEKNLFLFCLWKWATGKSMEQLNYSDIHKQYLLKYVRFRPCCCLTRERRGRAGLLTGSCHARSVMGLISFLLTPV